MAILMIFDEQIRSHELTDRPLVIGRSKQVDLPLSDSLLSRKHCRISPTEDGFELVDLDSSHGTWVNGHRIQRVRLELDDVIELGKTVLTFVEVAAGLRGDVRMLRNPEKARELIERVGGLGRISESGPPAVKQRSDNEADGSPSGPLVTLHGARVDAAGRDHPAAGDGSTPTPTVDAHESSARRARLAAARWSACLHGLKSSSERSDGSGEESSDVPERVLEAVAVQQYFKCLLKSSPELRRQVSDVVAQLLADPDLVGHPERLLEAVRKALGTRR